MAEAEIKDLDEKVTRDFQGLKIKKFLMTWVKTPYCIPQNFYKRTMVLMRSKEPCREEIILKMRTDVEYSRKYGTELAFVQ